MILGAPSGSLSLLVTPGVDSPEVVGRQRYGRPVDCWAIGVIMYILLSGNPPFYEETEEEDYENHDKNLFRKILAGDYEFDPPYWDDISQAAKELVTRLMEVEQDQRITAEEAISHEWISGNAASDKNIKDGVCAQIEKNFARAKWKVSGGAPCLSFLSQPTLVPQHGAVSLRGSQPQRIPQPPEGICGGEPVFAGRGPGAGEHPCPTASCLSPRRKPCE
uniref:Protein kinase domain-containing protein n=1 Tax=Amazona collaria TaxID=241587 RepID=A0A8B9J277_9PSIT